MAVRHPARLLLVLLLALSVVPGVAQARDASGRASQSGQSGQQSSLWSKHRHAKAPPANFTYRVVDHNVEHKTSAINLALQQAARTKARAILLQEVCVDQMKALRDAHPHWTVSWVPENPGRSCMHPLTTEYRNVGNVAIWTGGGRGRAQHFTWPDQAGPEERGLACVVYRRGARIRVCSVHLTAGSRHAKARLAQAGSLRLLTRKWVHQGDLVVVGGDFNAPQDSHVLDQMYLRRGNGYFNEATAPTRGFAPCRCFFSTLDHGHTKFDYVFFSANRMRTDAHRRLSVLPTPSDHHLVTAWARVSIAPLWKLRNRH